MVRAQAVGLLLVLITVMRKAEKAGQVELMAAQ